MNETQKLHLDSIIAARTFQKEYAADKDSYATADALKKYIEARRKLEKPSDGSGRYGAFQAYLTCQGMR